jgi:hypothetical protein
MQQPNSQGIGIVNDDGKVDDVVQDTVDWLQDNIRRNRDKQLRLAEERNKHNRQVKKEFKLIKRG